MKNGLHACMTSLLAATACPLLAAAAALLCAAGGDAFAQSPGTTAPAVPARTVGKWLVDLGRDYPLTPQAGLGDAESDAAFTLALMQAAARVEPDLAEAYLWQHDLLWALHREDDAVHALGQYVRLSPEDWSARLCWIAAMTESFQTQEDRLRFWQDQFQRPNLPGEVASDLYRRMAEHAYNRADIDAAAKDIASSLKAFPDNLATRRLRVAMSKPADQPLAQVDLALNLVRLSPAQPMLAWDLARLLDDLSLTREAQRWYTHALAVFQRTGEGQPPPGEFLLDMAASQTDAGQLDAAEKLVRQVITDEGDGPVPHRLLARIARLRNQPEQAAAELRAAREAYESAWAREADTADPDLAAEMAWFYCVEAPDIARALTLAETAMTADLPSTLARRSFGWAAVQTVIAEPASRPSVRSTTQPASRPSLADRARRELDSIVGADDWAAIALADLKKQGGDVQGAIRLLTGVAGRHRTGLLFEECTGRLAALKAPVPPPPARTDVKKLLADFDESVLMFATDPKKFLSLTITPLVSADGAVPPGRSIWCRFVLTNRSPYGITLGESLMVSPNLLLTVKSRGDRDRDYGGLLRISLNQRQLLAPGQSITVSQTIDLGPLRATLIGTPQAAQDIEIAAVVNPMWSAAQEKWLPAPGGFEAGPVHVRRSAVSPDDAGEAGFQGTVAASRTGGIPARIEAVERLMMWFAEHEHIRAGRLSYSARPVNADAIRAVLKERFADEAWEVRAALAETLRWVVLDGEWARPASELLGDTHWLVRMLAVRLFADHQGPKFDKVAAAMEEHDPDALVRATCATVRDRWRAATQPAATAPVPSPPDRF